LKLAIVIGVAEYVNDEFENLNACKNDAELFKEVISDMTNVDDILYLNENPKAYDTKKYLSDFIQKHKPDTIDEVIFYFSGHGGRYDDDFFYILSDFKESKKESTGLRNTELDQLIRTLRPKLFVKIVDACFCGTQYIKSESTARADLEKSAKDNQLNDIYFMFSSRDSQSSLAGKTFSIFTESLFTALLGHTGEIRYRDLTAFIADDLNATSAPKPIFISQADLIEQFGTVTETTHATIYKAFGISESPKEDDHKAPDAKLTKDNSLLDIVKRKAASDYCDEKLALSKLEQLKSSFMPEHWPQDISDIYTISVSSNVQLYFVPNSRKIGLWLNENISKEYFAIPKYKDESYEVEEYKALPKKPPRTNIATVVTFAGKYSGSSDETEYKLEKIKKTRQIVSGFEYTYHNDNNVLKINLEPNYVSAKPALIYMILIYSKTELVIHYSYESIKFTDWLSTDKPKCEVWRYKNIKLKDDNSILEASKEIISEIACWAINEIKRSL
jgi:hypothetical protein